MKHLFFWKVWAVTERRATIAALLILLLSVIFCLTQVYDPLRNVIRWDVLSELSMIDIVVDTLRIESWQYGVTVPSPVVTEQFVASMMEPDFWMVRIFWGLFIVGISFVLAAITTLSRFWYLPVMIGLILLFAATRPEVLGVFGQSSRSLFLIAVILIGGLSYYFHAFRPDLGIAVRIAGMLGTLVLICLIVGFFSSVKFPALTAAAFGLPGGLLLTILFLLISSTEIMAGLVWLSTSDKMGKKKSGLVQFGIVSTLYLAYLLLIYLKNTRQIDWSISLLHPFFFAIIAGTLGIWGFRRRADSTNGTIPFRPTGFWIYCGLFVIALTFTGYVASTANDSLLEVLEDATVNSQLGMGLLFLFYVLINFYQPMHQGLAVHKVLYKPLRFGLTQTRLFGFVGVVVLFSIQRIYPFYQGIAGYFNGLGDVYASNEEYPLAEQYYKMALQQDFQNHKSNYALASLALRLNDENAAAFYFRQALTKNPSVQAYIGLSGLLIRESLFFDAVYSLQEGIRKFPDNGELLNNLGVLYAKTNVADSAYYYLEKARQLTGRSEIPSTNLLALLAKNPDPVLRDSLIAGLHAHDYLSWQANKLATQNLSQKFTPQDFQSSSVPKDSLLSASAMAYLVNYSMNQARTDSLPAKLLPGLAVRNPTLAQELEFAALYAGFYSGNKLNALEKLAVWAKEGGQRAPTYHKVLGHWYLQLGLYKKAIEELSAVEGTEGTIGLAIANALAGNGVVTTILLERLPEKSPALNQLKEALFSGVKPTSSADSLLAIAQKSPLDANFDAAIQANPFDQRIVTAAVHYYRKKNAVKKAYQIVLDALRMNETSAGIWEEYTYLSLAQGLLGQADEGEAQVKEFSTPSGYQQFVTRYQPMRALIEKERAEFQ
jgi:tetratricopeptide (TPR) repeat protein